MVLLVLFFTQVRDAVCETYFIPFSVGASSSHHGHFS